MGYTSYDTNLRSSRATSDGYHTKSVTQLFEQNVKQMVHESLNPKDLKTRECLDSKEHPNSLAVILGLDVTGSMGHIPHMLIKDGLPTMMSKIVEFGSPDAALCFVAIGDLSADKAPIQIAQFESGDLELDTHLKNTWLEGNGGGNGGESYALAWYFAANHTKIDCFDKRGEKGILVTIGDEDVHKNYDGSLLRNKSFGNTSKIEDNITAAELLAEAQKRYHVYHIGLPSSHSMGYWKELLGNHFVETKDYTEIPKIVADLVVKHTQHKHSTVDTSTDREDSGPGNNIVDDTDVVFVK